MKHLSAKQLEANKRNAQESTGPKTPEGMAVSKMNASKNSFFFSVLSALAAKFCHRIPFKKRTQTNPKLPALFPVQQSAVVKASQT
jgi:hypothetical protein